MNTSSNFTFVTFNKSNRFFREFKSNFMATQKTTTETNTSWSFIKKFGFRFFFTFFPSYLIIELVIRIIKNANGPDSAITQALNSIVIWVAENIFYIQHELTFGPNGSGDTTANYINLFLYLNISFLIAIIWSILDHKRPHYNKMNLYLRTFIRYYLASLMFSYGFSKVFTLQFHQLSLFDLIKTYGNSSPMGLMWNFMEYSDLYTRFSGYAEVFAGLLLLFRRTTLFGAIAIIGVMGNVFMMNLSYDIPVKILSGLLTFMGFFLLYPDLQRLLNFLILNKATTQKEFLEYTQKPILKKVFLGFKVLIIFFFLFNNAYGSYTMLQHRHNQAKTAAHYGIYEIIDFVKNQDTIPPLTTDSKRWKRIIMDNTYGGIQKMNEKIVYCKVEKDSSSSAITLKSHQDTFSYTLKQHQKDSLYHFETILDTGDTLKISAKKKTPKDFLIINRGFHWINEYPFNR